MYSSLVSFQERCTRKNYLTTGIGILGRGPSVGNENFAEADCWLWCDGSSPPKVFFFLMLFWSKDHHIFLVAVGTLLCLTGPCWLKRAAAAPVTLESQQQQRGAHPLACLKASSLAGILPLVLYKLHLLFLKGILYSLQLLTSWPV